MTDEERDLINAFAGQEGSACDGVSEAMHRRELAVLHRYRPSLIVPHMKHGERGVAALVLRLPLSLTKARVTFRCPNGRPVHVQNTKSLDCEKRDPILC